MAANSTASSKPTSAVYRRPWEKDEVASPSSLFPCSPPAFHHSLSAPNTPFSPAGSGVSIADFPRNLPHIYNTRQVIGTSSSSTGNGNLSPICHQEFSGGGVKREPVEPGVNNAVGGSHLLHHLNRHVQPNQQTPAASPSYLVPLSPMGHFSLASVRTIRSAVFSYF